MTFYYEKHRGRDTWNDNVNATRPLTFDEARAVAERLNARIVPHPCGVKIYAVQRKPKKGE